MTVKTLLAENEHGKYCVPASSTHRWTAKLLLAGHVHEPETLAFILRHACRDQSGIVVHAGAYFGDFLPALAKAGIYVIAFEPNDESFHCAKQTIALNGLDDVELHHAALGEASYQSALVKEERADGRLFDLGGGSFVDAERGTQLCNVTTIDEVVSANHHVSVIHLDVEGYEHRALRGAIATIARCQPIIIVERVPTPAWLSDHLTPIGYQKTGTVDRNTIFSQVQKG